MDQVLTHLLIGHLVADLGSSARQFGTRRKVSRLLLW